ncbi:hypothetical protein MBANPS3_004010 [Mucor bainieri]
MYQQHDLSGLQNGFVKALLVSFKGSQDGTLAFSGSPDSQGTPLWLVCAMLIGSVRSLNA